MRGKAWYVMGLCAAAVLACRDSTRPDENDRDRVDLVEPARFVQSGCTKVWSGGSGNWSSITAWSPWGTPGPSDVACILAPSGTVVTVGSTVDIPELVIGGGINDVRVECSAGSGSVRPTRVWVRSGATLDVRSCVSWGTLQSDIVDVEGTLRLGAVPVLPDTLKVSGVLDLNGATVTSFNVDVYGSADVLATGNSLLYLNGPRHSFYADVSGSGTVLVRGAMVGTVTAGGSAPVRAAGTPAALKFRDLNLSPGSLQGSLDFETALPGSALIGDVLPGLDLRLYAQDTVRWRASSGSVVDNSGAVTVYARVLSARAISNAGQLTLASSAVTLDVDSLVNTLPGRVQVDGVHSISRNLGKWRNAGQVVVSTGAELRLEAGSFVAEPTGTQTGAFRVTTGALLTGAGSVGDVRVDSGTVSPGTQALPRNALSVGSLTLGSGATILLDVAGDSAGTYDVLTVRGNILAGGTLDLRTLAPFVGGMCGQVVPIIRLYGSRAGNFHRTTGLSLATDRVWRLAGMNAGWWITGGNPLRSLGLSVSSLALAEGGSPGVAYQCLGRRPTADVTVTPTSSGQLDLTPLPLTFPSSTWEWPQFLVVNPWDDTVAEGTHADTVRYRLTSADPTYNAVASTVLPVTISDNDGVLAADLAVTLVSSPTAVNANQVFAPRFRVTNNGPATSTGSTFTITPMAGLTLLTNQSNVSCTSASGVLTCTVGPLASGAQVEFFLEVRAGTTGSYANTVRITGIEGDLVPANNAFTWNITVN